MESARVTQAHSGILLADAWDMTMIEFQRAMDARYTPTEADKRKEMPGEEKAQSLMTHIESFRKCRKK